MGTSDGAPFAMVADDERRFYGRAVPSRGGAHARRRQAARQLRHRVAGCAGDWTMAAFREQAIARIREQVGAAG